MYHTACFQYLIFRENLDNWCVLGHVTQHVLLPGIIVTINIQAVSMVQLVDVLLLSLGVCDPPRHEVGKDICHLLCCGLIVFPGILLVRLLIAPLSALLDIGLLRLDNHIIPLHGRRRGQFSVHQQRLVYPSRREPKKMRSTGRLHIDADSNGIREER